MKGSFRKRGCICKSKKCTCGAKWEYRIDIGIDPITGRRKQKEKGGFKTRAEAEAAAALVYAEISQGTFVKGKSITFEEFSKDWIKTYENTGKVKISTVRVRQHEINRLLPYFAQLKIKDISKKRYKQHRKDQNKIRMRYRDTYHDKDFIFAKSAKNHGYPEHIKVIETRMNRLLKLAKLNEKLTPHSLRHTHTSLLAEAGVGLQEIMDRLGHKDDSTTKNVYLHVTKPKKKEASQKFSELMSSL
jgi:hypothetical protein